MILYLLNINSWRCGVKYQESESMDFINTFNCLNCKQKMLSMKKMEINKQYASAGAYKTQAKYGKKIVLKLDDEILHLPARFLSLGEDAVTQLSYGGFLVAKIPLREWNYNMSYKLELQHILPIGYFTNNTHQIHEYMKFKHID